MVVARNKFQKTNLISQPINAPIPSGNKSLKKCANAQKAIHSLSEGAVKMNEG